MLALFEACVRDVCPISYNKAYVKKAFVFSVLIGVGLSVLLLIARASTGNISVSPVSAALVQPDSTAHEGTALFFETEAVPSSTATKPVSYWKNLFDANINESLCTRWITELKKTSGSYAGSQALYTSAFACFDGYVAMWRATGDEAYLDVALRFANAVIDEAVPSSTIQKSQYKDSFLGWPNFRSGTYYGQELSLTEVYLWRYVTVMLREMSEDAGLMSDTKYKKQYDDILGFTEDNIYKKWRARGAKSGSPFKEIYRSRTHLASHWGHVCMNLAQISKDAGVASECSQIVKEINTGMPTLNGASLKKQLTPLPGNPKALYWTNQWGFTPESLGWPTDVSHGAAEVGYIAEAFDYGFDFTKAELDGIIELTNTVILPDGKKVVPPWIAGADYACPIDYSTTSVCPRIGDLFTEGFVKLGRYSEPLQLQLEIYAATHKKQIVQLYGNGALNAAVLSGDVRL